MTEGSICIRAFRSAGLLETGQLRKENQDEQKGGCHGTRNRVPDRQFNGGGDGQVRNGRCGIAPITRYDTSHQKVKLAGEVKGLKIDAYIDPSEGRKMDLYTQLRCVRPSRL